MKEIKLMNLSLKNFKGCESFSYAFNGSDAKAFGNNGTYKTTLFDGFLWLIFGKDSNNRADFSIKTLKDGKEINNLEHEVEASFYIDKQPLLLKKVYKEKYTKKRSAPIAEFTGHETNHYIDDVPVKKKEYEEKVSSIIDEDVFKLLTSPTFFNENLKWQDRRKTLLEVCGDIEEEDVLAFNKGLKDLPTILQGRTIEDHRKVIAARRAEINKELNMIPVRIDEINNSMPKDEIDVPSIETEVSEIEKELDEHATQINSIKNGSAIIDLEALARALEHELKVIQDELEAEAKEKGFQVQAKIQEEQSNVAILKREKDDKQHELERRKHEVEDIDKLLVTLRSDWAVVDKRKFENNHDEDTCPTCNQSLPVEQVQAAHEKALNEFNLKRSSDLEKINADGKKMSVKKDELTERIQVLADAIEEFIPKIETKEKAISKLETELNTLRDEIKNARQNERYLSKIQEVEDVNLQIGSLKENAQMAVIDIEKEVTELRTKRTELNAQIAQQAQIKANHKRIAELEEQQKDLATEFEKLEHELYLTEQFIQSKVKLLEEKINSKFKYARFNLFKTNINGGIEEICETTYEGVPFSSGLNNAARINVGIDIINTLTEHYGIRAPIFVDNSEAVTRLADTDSQLISLVVSEKDKQLRIEKQADEEGGAA